MASQEATSWLAEATTTIVFWASFPLVAFTFSSFSLCSLPILLAAIVFMADCNCMRRDFKLNSPFSSPILPISMSLPPLQNSFNVCGNIEPFEVEAEFEIYLDFRAPKQIRMRCTAYLLNACQYLTACSLRANGQLDSSLPPLTLPIAE